jgi:hypothetical protein
MTTATFDPKTTSGRSGRAMRIQLELPVRSCSSPGLLAWLYPLPVRMSLRSVSEAWGVRRIEIAEATDAVNIRQQTAEMTRSV